MEDFLRSRISRTLRLLDMEIMKDLEIVLILGSALESPQSSNKQINK